MNGRILSLFLLSKLLQSVCGISIVIAAAVLSCNTHYTLCKTSLPLQVTIKVEILYKWPHFNSLTVDYRSPEELSVIYFINIHRYEFLGRGRISLYNL